MATAPPPDEMARRVRAALGYANLKLPAAEAATGISKFTLQRITSAAEPRGAGFEELEAIAKACNVPLSFFYNGFDDGPGVEDDRIAALEDQVAHLLRESITREQVEGIVRLRLLAANPQAAAAEPSSEGRRAPDAPTG